MNKQTKNQLQNTFQKSIFMLAATSFLMGCSSLHKTSDIADVQKDTIATGIANNAAILESQKQQTIAESPTVEIQKATVKTFNVNVRNASLETVLENIFENSDVNLIFPEPIQQNLNISLKNVTAFDFLETMKKIYKYDYELFGNNLIVYNNTIRTRVYNINHLIGTRQGTSELKITSGSLSSGNPNGGGNNNNTTNTNNTNNNSGGAVQSESSKLTTRVDSNFWSELSSVVSTIVQKNEKASVVVSPQTNTLVVSALASELSDVEKYLTTIHANIKRQVMIEAKIIEVELNSGQQTGINWSAFQRGSNISAGFMGPGSNLSTNNPLVTDNITSTPGTNLINTALNPALGLFSFAFQNNNFAAILNFLETQGSLQVLSSPRIATMNNQKAILKVGTDEFFVTNITNTNTSTASGTTSTPSVTTQPFFSGISLDITPQIDNNGMITMHVKPSVSSVSTVNKSIDLGSLGTYSLPLASSTITETDSVVKIPNNAIVAIGGLMKSYSKRNGARVPIASDAPGVGQLFRNNSSDISKYELVILLKPVIIENLSDWQRDLINVKERLSKIQPKEETIKINNQIK